MAVWNRTPVTTLTLFLFWGDFLQTKKKTFKFRKRWWEQNEATKAYVEHNIKKYELFGRPMWMLKLPKDFTCFHFGESMQTEERHRFGMAIALARPKGALEYVMLEVDRLILREVSKIKKREDSSVQQLPLHAV